MACSTTDWCSHGCTPQEVWEGAFGVYQKLQSCRKNTPKLQNQRKNMSTMRTCVAYEIELLFIVWCLIKFLLEELISDYGFESKGCTCNMRIKGTKTDVSIVSHSGLIDSVMILFT